ncbi:MAG TPA: sigma-70 family RNA polymerase sigma factor [Saprospiraceae bacterium]|nr:sigma-70 family RNA polymerase sigma factor [Saprospiraceae bacterium]
MSSNNQHLVQRLQSGDHSVISTLYDRYGDTLYGIVLRIVGQEDLAQDVIQESYVKIWKNAGRYDATQGTLFTWMLNICRNTAIDKTRSAHFRHKKKVHVVDDNINDHRNFAYEQKTDHIGLDEEVNNLEEKYRTVIDLIYFRGFTQREVVEQLNIPLGTVKSRVRIALRELRKKFLSDKTPLVILLSLYLI